MSLYILIMIHFLIVASSIAAALLLPAEITSAIVISLVFCVIAYLIFAAATVFAAVQSKEKAMQNGGLITASFACFLLTFLASVILAFLHLSVRVHVLLEMIVMVIGLVFVLMMLMAKCHIEKQ